VIVILHKCVAFRVHPGRKGRFKFHFCVLVHIHVTPYPPVALAHPLVLTW